MKDKSIIWMTAGGIALWILATYQPVREPIVEAVKHLWHYIMDIF